MCAHRAATAVATLLLTSWGCGRSQPADQAPPAPPTAVQLAAASQSAVDDATEYVGILKSLRSTTIQPQVDGQISQIHVKSGDRVARGTPLMEIDPRRQQAAVSSQEADRTARQANVALARQQLQRATDLYAAGAIAKAELEQAQTTLQTADANFAALQAQVQQQQVQLRYYTVAAPAAGIVGDVPARLGMQVTTQTALTTIDDNDTLELNVSVPIERASALKNGLPVVVLSSDGTETLAMTSITFVSPRVEDQTQSVLVKGMVRNSDGRLRSSQFVRARIVWATRQALTIPVVAVLRISGQHFAFVAEDAGGKLVARQRPIKVGPIVGDNYLVLDGLKPGDRVVVSGAQKLADGAPVQAGQ
ncbi:MAG: efflux RND transporter periplasmic adaptor subunit [Acidobacteriota bacterium]